MNNVDKNIWQGSFFIVTFLVITRATEITLLTFSGSLIQINTSLEKNYKNKKVFKIC